MFWSLTGNDNAALAAADDAIFTHWFDGCSDFHVDRELKSVNDASFREVVRSKLNADFIAGHQSNSVHAKFPRDVTDDCVSIFQFDAKVSSRQRFFDNAAKLDNIFTG